MKIETIQTAKHDRQVFTDVGPEYLEFTPGVQVLSSEMENLGDITPIFYVKKHEPGTKHWSDGGYECVDIHGNWRAFHFGCLIIHPKVLEKDGKIIKNNVTSSVKQRGRKRIHDKVAKDPTAPKGKRGRPALSAEEKANRELQVANTPKKTGKRGRPPMDPDKRKTQPIVLKGYGKRGRPSVEAKMALLLTKQQTPNHEAEKNI